MNRRLAKLIFLGLLALLASPMVQAATYTAVLSGANENPSNLSTGTGTTIVSLDTTAHQLHVTVVFSGLVGTTTASHIHCCVAPNGNAGVATTTPTFTGFPLGVTSGTYDAVFDTTQASSWNPAFITANGGTPASAEAVLATGIGAGQAYLNVHSNVFPGGEIRGFLVLAPAPALNVPTLSTWGLALAAIVLGVVGLAAARRRNALRS